MTQHTEVSSWIVLVVDDEPDSLEAAADVLEYHGASTYRAQTGREAIHQLEVSTPTFVLTDLSMPEMDGWALLSHIRKNAYLAHIPVIALTAHAMVGDQNRGLTAGFNGYLTKPFNVTTLIDEIATWLPTKDSITAAGESKK